jgi:hypothetical protein
MYGLRELLDRSDSAHLSASASVRCSRVYVDLRRTDRRSHASGRTHVCMHAYENVHACDNFISYVCMRMRMCRPVIAQDFLEALKVVRPYSTMAQKQRGSRKRAKNSSTDSENSITPRKEDVATLQGARTVGAQHQVQCQVKQEHASSHIAQS